MNALGWIIIGILIGVALMRIRDDAVFKQACKEVKDAQDERDWYKRFNESLITVNGQLRKAVNGLLGLNDAD